MESMHSETDFYYGEKIEEPNGKTFLELRKMQPTQGDIVIPSEENVVRLPLGFRGKPKSQFRRAQYYCFDDSRYYELPFYIETEEDYDSSSSFDREFLAKALMAYAESKGVSSPDEFALELLSILDGKETTYDPNGPYL